MRAENKIRERDKWALLCRSYVATAFFASLFVGCGITKYDKSDSQISQLIDCISLPVNKYGVFPSFYKKIIHCVYFDNEVLLYQFANSDLLEVKVKDISEKSPFYVYSDKSECVSSIGSVYNEVRGKCFGGLWYAIYDIRNDRRCVYVDIYRGDYDATAIYIHIGVNDTVKISSGGRSQGHFS